MPYEEGGRLSELYELAGELEREERADGVLVRARIPAALAHRFGDFAVNGAGARRRTPERWSCASRRLTTAARLPTRAHHGDAGLDLYAAEAATIGPRGGRASVGTGLAVEIPPGHARPGAAALGARGRARDRRSSTRPA